MIGDLKDVADLLNLAPAVVASVLLIIAGVKLAPRARRLGHLVDDLAGEPARPGTPRRPGVMERLQEVEDRTGELVRNHGSSMKDSLERLDARSARHDTRMEALDKRLHRIEIRVCPRGGKEE